MPARGEHVVGIDLGTTHTVVAFASRDGGEVSIFHVPALAGATEIEARSLFASALYAPTSAEAFADPWGDAPWCVGELARRRGVEVPGRLVASSKSWLAYPRVDRTAAILPWGADENEPDLPKISPVDAAAKILGHVRHAWDDAHPNAPLAEQELVLTVPASFDDVARELTLEGAARAGLAPRLLEEPQAAFYDYLGKASADDVVGLVDRAGGDALVLVADVGGGTTDLSLLRVVRSAGTRPFEVERVAVGHHLLLGGDNMDLALAHLVEAKISPGNKLDPQRFAALTQSCRAAKESLLGGEPPKRVEIALASRGSALVGGTLRAELTKDEAERVVLDGFWPAAQRDAKPERARGALVAFGLPYERDAAVTRHVAHFFARHAGVARAPNAVLLNGGVFLADRIRDRFVSVLASWGGEKIEVLPHPDPDLAVARGAVRYGLARLGHGVRIEAGAARGYYVGLAAEPNAPRPLVCVVPRGAKEGIVHAAKGRTFALKVGRPVRFEMFASDEANDEPGTVARLDEDRFDALPPAFASFESGASGAEIAVELEGELTPIGTLDLACVERASNDATPRRFRLAFDVRGGASRGPGAFSSMPPSRGAPSSLSVKTLAAEARAAETQKLAQAREAIEKVFGKDKSSDSPRLVKDLGRDLEKILGDRASWDTHDARALADVLLSNARARKRSPDHERQWWALTGFALRPGFGDPNDPARIQALAPLFDEKLAFVNEVRGWQQFWIAWRRAAGGLDEVSQVGIRAVADPLLAPTEARLRKPKGWKAEGLADLVDLASSLERVPPTKRSELGAFVLERTWTDRDPRLWVAIGRIGAREPAYASAHHVVSPIAAERWLDHLLREKWEGARELQRAATDLSRMTGDRARDIGDGPRREVERRLEKCGAPEAWRRAVHEVVAADEADKNAFFGESLPVGLRLIG